MFVIGYVALTQLSRVVNTDMKLFVSFRKYILYSITRITYVVYAYGKSNEFVSIINSKVVKVFAFFSCSLLVFFLLFFSFLCSATSAIIHPYLDNITNFSSGEKLYENID